LSPITLNVTLPSVPPVTATFMLSPAGIPALSEAISSLIVRIGAGVRVRSQA